MGRFAIEAPTTKVARQSSAFRIAIKPERSDSAFLAEGNPTRRRRRRCLKPFTCWLWLLSRLVSIIVSEFAFLYILPRISVAPFCLPLCRSVFTFQRGWILLFFPLSIRFHVSAELDGFLSVCSGTAKASLDPQIKCLFCSPSVETTREVAGLVLCAAY